jgi:hypothetical protein
MQEGPILWVDVFGEVMYEIIDVEVGIVCLEYDGCGVIGSVWNEVEVTAASELVDFKATPN